MAADLTWRCDAILFDMDGTLIDSTVAVERQWRRWALRHGLDPAPIVAVAHGRRTLDTLGVMAPHLASHEEAERFDAEEAADSEGVVAVPGALALITGLPLNRWAIVTSAKRALAEARLLSVCLPVPPVVVSADDVNRGKPDPEGYLLAAQMLGARPASCLVLEDTPAGVAAGLDAGMQVIGVARTYPAARLGAPVCVPDLRPVAATPGRAGIDVRILNGWVG
jgi:sugar-phosphatase